MLCQKIIIVCQGETCCDYSKVLERSVEYHDENGCLERLGCLDVDLVILDCVFETDASADLVKNIKQTYPGIPVIIVTSVASEDFVIKTFKCGARDLFKKPLNTDDLRKSVDTVLCLRQASLEQRKPPLFIDPDDVLYTQVHAGNIPENLTRAIEYIDDNLPNALILDEIARTAYMSKFHFCRMFKKYVGLPPMQYAIQMRLKKAMTLLQQNGLSITTIALKSGFNDLSGFNRQFRKLNGSSPSVFRDSMRTKE